MNKIELRLTIDGNIYLTQETGQAIELKVLPPQGFAYGLAVASGVETRVGTIRMFLGDIQPLGWREDS